MKSSHIDSLLRALVIKKGSDLHLQVDTRPVFRIHGELVFTDLEPVTKAEMEEYVRSIVSGDQKKRLEETFHVDVSYDLAGVARFRVNIFKQRGQWGLAMRAIPFEVPTIADLDLPPVVTELAAKPNGLVLVTGPTGSGKTTTLAAIIDHINKTRKAHIITIEDPLEFMHTNKSCVVNQREVGLDTVSFSSALRDGLREDPDVILVGEMRDLDTISNAITAAETGHLVFSTLHTNDVAQSVDRIIDVFPPHQQPQIRIQLAASLQGIVAQTLLRKKDGSGRIAAFEIMVATSAIKNLIKEGKTNQIYNVVQTSRQDNMQLMQESLKTLYKKGIVTFDEAIRCVSNPKAFEQLVKS